jgi:superfamily II DNA helicase RecQ
MNLRVFTTRLAPENLSQDQNDINTFMSGVTVKKTSTQFVPGNPDYWSILVFYEAENGTKTKTKEKPPVVTEAELTENEQGIVSALKIWRKDRAADIHLPEFMICHNATLINIAKEKPSDLATLSKIKGLGDQKVAKYGDDIIAIVNAF